MRGDARGDLARTATNQHKMPLRLSIALGQDWLKDLSEVDLALLYF